MGPMNLVIRVYIELSIAMQSKEVYGFALSAQLPEYGVTVLQNITFHRLVGNISRKRSPVPLLKDISTWAMHGSIRSHIT